VIVISGIVTISDSNRHEVVEFMKKLRDETIKLDRGVVAYRFGIDIDNANEIHVYEEWESVEALKEHGQKPHSDAFRALRSKLGFSTSGFSRWQAEELGEF
jgi:quinol monooxygenase YgiN